MADIAFPTLTRSAPSTMTWGIAWNTQVFASPLSQSIRTQELPGARWMVSLRFGNLEGADAAAVQAWLLKLRGRANRALLWNWERESPRGTIAGTPLINGADQTGAALAIDGCTVGTTLLAGDYIGVTVGSRAVLLMVTEDATANGSGQMTLAVEPPLVEAPADNAAITLTKPSIAMMATEDTVKWAIKPGRFTDYELQFVEAWT